MSSAINRCLKNNYIISKPPSWLENNVVWEVMTGSMAYGISSNTSDVDVYAVTIPPKSVIFPHVAGEILGFDQPIERFYKWQEYHVKDKEKNKMYDFTVFSIVKYFKLCMDCNPNMIDSIFVPRRCVLYSNAIGEHIRENRFLFLNKAAWKTFRSYSFSQMAKLRNKNRSENPTRAELIQKYGFDTKFGSHAVRLLLQIEEMLLTGDLDIEKNSVILKAVRNGEWTLEHLEQWVNEKEKYLETIFANSTLRNKPETGKIKKVLIECLEMHYGSLDHVIAKNKNVDDLVLDIETILSKYKS